MRILIAPDSFKGSLSSLDAARIIARGLESAGVDDIQLAPIADGGEGTVDSLCIATRGTIYNATVQGPSGEPVNAKWGVLGDGQTAVIELAAASGIMLTTPETRKPLTASTYGTGELILAAIKHGCKRIIAGIGASACTDGGAGMAQALGAILTDAAGRTLPQGGLALHDLAHIDITPVKALLSGIELTAAWSVNNPLCGENSTAIVYSPGKGATPDEVVLLDRALSHYADIIESDLGIDVRSVPGGGCGGGTGAGMYAFMGARLVSGFQLIVEETGFAEHIPQADYIITGEGCTEKSTLFGKVPMGIAQMAKAHSVPVIILSGSLKKGWRELYRNGVTTCLSISDGAIPLEDAMKRAEPLLYNAAEAVGRLLMAGFKGL